MKKWIEMTVNLVENGDFNELLKKVVKPAIENLYLTGMIDSWHYFREPSLCWRVYTDENNIEAVKAYMIQSLNDSDTESWYFGAFLQEGEEYNGESELYGEDAWILCYKRWEAGSNLALLLCTQDTDKTIPFHYTRDIHLFENQLGLELSDAITLYLKWLLTLMKTDERYNNYIDTLKMICNETQTETKIKGL